MSFIEMCDSFVTNILFTFSSFFYDNFHASDFVGTIEEDEDDDDDVFELPPLIHGGNIRHKEDNIDTAQLLTQSTNSRFVTSSVGEEFHRNKDSGSHKINIDD